MWRARRHMRHISRAQTSAACRPRSTRRASLRARPSRAPLTTPPVTSVALPAKARRTDPQIARAPPPRRCGCETKAWRSAADTPSASPTPSRLRAWPSCADTPPAPAAPPVTSDRPGSSARAPLAQPRPDSHPSEFAFASKSISSPSASRKLPARPAPHSSASFRARLKTLSSIARVSLPVFVFCSEG